MPARASMTSRLPLAAIALLACARCLPIQTGSGSGAAPAHPYVLPGELSAVGEILEANGLKQSPYAVLEADQQGHVVSLYLENAGLAVLPGNLDRFPSLDYVDLTGNRLADLPDLSGMGILRALHIGGNRLCHPSAATQAGLDTLRKAGIVAKDWPERQDCREDFDADSLAVRAILDANGLAGVPVMSVAVRRGDMIRSLNLDLRKLGSLPAAIGELEWLESLHLANNRLASLPPEIGRLRSLRSLRLEGNRLAAIPDGICALSDLDSLGLEGNLLETLPGCLIAFDSLVLEPGGNRICQVPQSLIDWIFAHADSYWQRSQVCEIPVGYSADSLLVRRMLDLSGSRLEVREIATVKKGRITKLRMDTYGVLKLDANLAGLDSLDTLEIRNSPLTELPDALGDCLRLKYLGVYASKLDSLPSGIGRARNLESLYIGIGNLTSLPASLGDLGRLKELRIPGNKVAAIPDWIGKLASLEVLQVDQNALASIHGNVNNCAKLKTVVAEFNRLTEFVFRPEALPLLTNIQLRGNAIADLPLWITGFGNRAAIELSSNAICHPDPAISSWAAANKSVKLNYQTCPP